MSSRATDVLKQIPRELLDSPVSDTHVAEISRQLVKWEELAPWLELTPAEEEEVKRSGDYGHQKRDLLRTWRQRKGNDATYRRLITALCIGQNIELIEKIKVLLVPPEPQGIIRESSVDVLQMFREHLIDCCKGLRHPSREQWPLLGLSHYVELTLHEILSRKEGQVAAKEVKLHKIFASSHKAKRKFILIEGAPGSGKTTLIWRVLQQWAEGKQFQEFSLLIPISLSNADSTVLNATCLADIIPHESEDLCEKVAKAIAEESGKGVCFLVDAWDEAPPAFFQQSSYLRQFLKGGVGKKNLPCCSIIVASRPVASATLLPLATSHVVISGFNSFSIEEFIDVSLSSDEEKERFSQMLEIKPELAALCHLPLYISIVMRLFKTSNKALPSTQTELYTAFILSKLIRHRSLRMTTDGNSFDEVTDIADLPEEMVIKFRALCELAYTGVREQNASFDKKDLKSIGITETVPDTLSLMMDNKEIVQLGMRHNFSCLLYIIQEYMAAYHILFLGHEEQKKAVTELLKNSPLSMTLPFYAGLSKLENKDILNLLVKKAEVPLDWHSVTEALKNAVNQPGLDPRRQFLASLDCIYESGKFEEYSHLNLPVDSGFTRVLGENTATICLGSFFLTPSRCLSLGYFLKHAVIKKNVALLLNGCFITDVSFPLIVTPLCSAEQLSYNLYIAHNHITHRALECIRGGLGNIKSIAIGGSSQPGFNPFLALKYLTEGLNRSPCFKNLSLFSNFTSDHKYHLLVLIMSCKSLQMLQFFSCNLSGAIPVLAAGLKYRRISKLFMDNCSLNDEDLCELGEVLHHCCNTLFVLEITSNTFSSEALTQFLKAIRNSRCQLHSLYCDQLQTLNATQQSIVDDIQDQRSKTRQIPILCVGRHDSSIADQDTTILQSLPPEIVHGLRLYSHSVNNCSFTHTGLYNPINIINRSKLENTSTNNVVPQSLPPGIVHRVSVIIECYHVNNAPIVHV